MYKKHLYQPLESMNKTAESLKYQLVSIGSMNSQINLRLPESMLASAKAYVEKYGYGSIQEFIKETLREKLFEEPEISKQELALVKKLIQASEKKNLYGTEEQLFTKLKRREYGIHPKAH